MLAVQDFEDLLSGLARHRVRYLIVGGLAFIYHAKPRYTKDMDIWVDGSDRNIERTNRALAEFGSPELLDLGQPDQILQLGIAPNRIDILIDLPPLRFAAAWRRRQVSAYGSVNASWIDLESLLEVKSSMDHPRHQEDARVLRQVLAMNKRPARVVRQCRAPGEEAE